MLFLVVLQSVWDLVLPARMILRFLQWEVWRLDHWTTREFPVVFIKEF